MKPGIHTEYQEVNIVMTDGTPFKTRSCMGQDGDTLRSTSSSTSCLDGRARMIDTGGQVAKLNKKFGGLGIKK
jgi:large subunit ribosomal protein L31